MKKPLGVLLVLSVFIAQAQLTRDSVLVESHYRTFNFKKPINSGKNRSLIFVLHGSGGNGQAFSQAAVALEAKSDKENLLLVYPDGYKRYWNECRKEANTPPNLESINEEAFFEGMIQYFISKYGVDAKKVFAIGMSGGGHMAYKLAMTIPEKIKAITVVVASLPTESNFDCVAKNIAKPVMIINGTDDPLNKWSGGEIKLGNNISLGVMRSTEESFRYWSALAGYTGEPIKTVLPDINKTDGETIERYSYQSAGKPEVVLLKVIGGKHSFPKDIDAFVEAWEFFKRQQ